jgi:hypothetical protein
MVFDNAGLPSSNGTWIGKFDSMHTALNWSTNLSSDQYYRIRLAVKLPSDFGNWDGVCPLKVWRKSAGALSNVGVKVTLHDIAGNVTNINQLDAANGTADTWEQFAAPAITPATYNFQANGWCYLTLEVKANGVGNDISVGRIDFNYVTP